MGRERLSDKRIAAIKAPATGRTEIFDTVRTGLSMRVTANGIRSWSLLYRLDGQLRRDTLGAYPRIGLADARQIAGEALETVGRGIDPRLIKAEAEAAQATREADTVEAIAEQFLKKHAAQRRWSEFERVIRRDIIPEWRSRPITEITRRDVLDMLDTIGARAPVQANRTLTILKILFGWALDREIVTADPTSRLKKPTLETTRERVLSDDELPAFWLGSDRLGWPFGPLLQVLLLTASRKSEIGDLRWSEIDPAAKLIEIPGDRYKNGRPHLIPLSDAAAAILAGLPRFGEESGLVFTTNDRTAVSGFSKAKATLDGYMLAELRKGATEPDKLKLAPWIIHDLRRTARTGLSRLGVAPDIGERVLGHTIGGIRGRYDRYAFLDEKRDALDRWAVHLAGIVDPQPGRIVALRRPGARS